MPVPTTPPRPEQQATSVPTRRGPRRRRLARLLLPAAALTLAAVLTPSVARAEVGTFTDPQGDGARDSSGTGPRIYGDVTSVRLNYTDDEVKLKVGHGPQGRFGDTYYFWLDTRAKNPGPELVVQTYGSSLFVSRTSDFGRYGADVCAIRKRLHYRSDDQVIFATIPRRCLTRRDGSLPQRLRLNVDVSMDASRGDYAPAKETFGPWVRAGRVD